MQTFSPQSNAPRVVIIGAGFGGWQVAQSLAGSGAAVVLIDRQPYHTFVPLLYQVAVGQLEPQVVVTPLDRPRSGQPWRFWQAEVQSIQLQKQEVHTDRGAIAYDYLVIATGSRTQHLQVKGVAEHGFLLRSLPDAIAIKNQLDDCWVAAQQSTTPADQQRWLTVAIGGGGTTGVELAGALVERFQALAQRDDPKRQLPRPVIHLIQSGPMLLPDLPRSLGTYAARKLQQIGVTVHLQQRIQQVEPDRVWLHTGEWLAATTVIWVTGQVGQPPPCDQPVALSSQHKVQVLPTLQLPQFPTVYAIGDVAEVPPVSLSLTGVAPEALQQGVATAQNLKRQFRGQHPQPFRYLNKGRLAIIGDYAGVGLIGRWHLRGWLAWVLWLGVHGVYLPGWRSRSRVVAIWISTYVWQRLWRSRPPGS